jgi:DNA modification methylase
MNAPYFEDDWCTIYHGDCLEVMDSLGVGCVESVITSPPYNAGLTPGGNGRGFYGHTTQHGSRFTTDGYDGASDALPPEEYEEKLRSWLTLAAVCSTGSVWWNMRPSVAHGRARLPYGMDFRFLADPTNDRFGLRQIVVWDRGVSTGTNRSFITSRQEWVMLFCWAGWTLAERYAFGDIWRLGIEHNKRGHPCPFPEALPARCLELASPASVLDPFMGTGTTLSAARKVGVRSIGIDLSERYCETAVKRLAQEELDFAAGVS